jgi:hypothetical protein
MNLEQQEEVERATRMMIDALPPGITSDIMANAALSVLAVALAALRPEHRIEMLRGLPSALADLIETLDAAERRGPVQ